MGSKLRRGASTLLVVATVLGGLSAIGAFVLAGNLAEECHLGTNLVGQPELVCRVDAGARVTAFVGLLLVAAVPLVPYVALARIMEALAGMTDDGGMPVAALDPLGGPIPDHELPPLEQLPPPEGAPRRPGWYPDPTDPDLERRWTGAAWATDPPRRRG